MLHNGPTIHVAKTRPPVRESGVSRALRAMGQGDLKTARSFNFRIFPTADLEARVRAYRLAYECYRAKGYVSPNSQELIVDETDLRPRTFTLLAEDKQGASAATVSLVFDDANGLPCDALYCEELDSLRAVGARVAEVTRLAIADAHAHDRPLLARLFNLIYIYAYHLERCTHFVIEVSPRHVAFYRRLLCFKVLGAERPCPRVSDAPAVLLVLDFSKSLAVRNNPCFARTLSTLFFPEKEERALARGLGAAHRPMSQAEAGALGLCVALG